MSPILFNVVVDNVVWTWLTLTVKCQTLAQEGLVLIVGRCLGFFNANNNMVGAWDSEWLQNVLNVLIGLFKRYGLIANFVNSRTMMCQPRSLWSVIGPVGSNHGSLPKHTATSPRS